MDVVVVSVRFEGAGDNVGKKELNESLESFDEESLLKFENLIAQEVLCPYEIEFAMSCLDESEQLIGYHQSCCEYERVLNLPQKKKTKLLVMKRLWSSQL